jgi:hypothetical protein
MGTIPAGGDGAAANQPCAGGVQRTHKDIIKECSATIDIGCAIVGMGLPVGSSVAEVEWNEQNAMAF